MSRLYVDIGRGPFRHEVVISDVPVDAGWNVKIGCSKFTFAELAQLEKDKPACSSMSTLMNASDDWKIICDEWERDGGTWGELCVLVNQLPDLVRIATGKPLSEFLEPESAPEQRYVVVDLGAEAAGVEEKYVWWGAKNGTCTHGDAPNYGGTIKEIAKNIAETAFDRYGWHCEVRPWPEQKLWCVKWEQAHRVLYAPKGYLEDRFVDFPKEPQALDLSEAEKILKDLTTTYPHSKFMLSPYPPPVAVKWAVRDNVGEWWKKGDMTQTTPVFFDNKQYAQNLIDEQPAFVLEVWEPKLVGFDAVGNEVED